MFLYAECRALIAYAFEGRLADMTILLELFVEIYTCFCDSSGTDGEEIRRILYWHFHDYSEILVTQSVREGIDPQLDFLRRLCRMQILQILLICIVMENIYRKMSVRQRSI